MALRLKRLLIFSWAVLSDSKSWAPGDPPDPNPNLARSAACIYIGLPTYARDSYMKQVHKRWEEIRNTTFDPCEGVSQYSIDTVSATLGYTINQVQYRGYGPLPIELQPSASVKSSASSSALSRLQLDPAAVSMSELEQQMQQLQAIMDQLQPAGEGKLSAAPSKTAVPAGIPSEWIIAAPTGALHKVPSMKRCTACVWLSLTEGAQTEKAAKQQVEHLWEAVKAGAVDPCQVWTQSDIDGAAISLNYTTSSVAVPIYKFDLTSSGVPLRWAPSEATPPEIVLMKRMETCSWLSLPQSERTAEMARLEIRKYWQQIQSGDADPCLGLSEAMIIGASPSLNYSRTEVSAPPKPAQVQRRRFTNHSAPWLPVTVAEEKALEATSVWNATRAFIEKRAYDENVRLVFLAGLERTGIRSWSGLISECNRVLRIGQPGSKPKANETLCHADSQLAQLLYTHNSYGPPSGLFFAAAQDEPSNLTAFESRMLEHRRNATLEGVPRLVFLFGRTGGTEGEGGMLYPSRESDGSLHQPDVQMLAMICEQAGMDLRIFVHKRSPACMIASAMTSNFNLDAEKLSTSTYDSAMVLHGQLDLLDPRFIFCGALASLAKSVDLLSELRQFLMPSGLKWYILQAMFKLVKSNEEACLSVVPVGLPPVWHMGVATSLIGQSCSRPRLPEPRPRSEVETTKSSLLVELIRLNDLFDAVYTLCYASTCDSFRAGLAAAWPDDVLARFTIIDGAEYDKRHDSIMDAYAPSSDQRMGVHHNAALALCHLAIAALAVAEGHQRVLVLEADAMPLAAPAGMDAEAVEAFASMLQQSTSPAIRLSSKFDPNKFDDGVGGCKRSCRCNTSRAGLEGSMWERSHQLCQLKADAVRSQFRTDPISTVSHGPFDGSCRVEDVSAYILKRPAMEILAELYTHLQLMNSTALLSEFYTVKYPISIDTWMSVHVDTAVALPPICKQRGRERDFETYVQFKERCSTTPEAWNTVATFTWRSFDSLAARVCVAHENELLSFFYPGEYEGIPARVERYGAGAFRYIKQDQNVYYDEELSPCDLHIELIVQNLPKLVMRGGVLSTVYYYRTYPVLPMSAINRTVRIISSEDCHNISARGESPLLQYHSKSDPLWQVHVPLSVSSGMPYTARGYVAAHPASMRKFLFNLVLSVDSSPYRGKWARAAKSWSQQHCSFLHFVPKFVQAQDRIFEENADLTDCASSGYKSSSTFLSPKDFNRVLLNSTFTLAPLGRTMESYRLFEASEAGSIPVVLREQLEGRNTSGQTEQCEGLMDPYRGAPWLVVDSLEDAYAQMQDLAAKPDELNARSLEVRDWHDALSVKVAMRSEAVLGEALSRASRGERALGAIATHSTVGLVAAVGGGSWEEQVSGWLQDAGVSVSQNTPLPKAGLVSVSRADALATAYSCGVEDSTGLLFSPMVQLVAEPLQHIRHLSLTSCREEVSATCVLDQAKPGQPLLPVLGSLPQNVRRRINMHKRASLFSFGAAPAAGVSQEMSDLARAARYWLEANFLLASCATTRLRAEQLDGTALLAGLGQLQGRSVAVPDTRESATHAWGLLPDDEPETSTAPLTWGKLIAEAGEDVAAAVRAVAELYGYMYSPHGALMAIGGVNPDAQLDFDSSAW